MPDFLDFVRMAKQTSGYHQHYQRPQGHEQMSLVHAMHISSARMLRDEPLANPESLGLRGMRRPLTSEGLREILSFALTVAEESYPFSALNVDLKSIN